MITPELAKYICEISSEINRQVALLIDRRGHIKKLIVGDAHQVHLPSLGRGKSGASRFNGLRLVHTHLHNEDLTEDDLTDLALLHFDMVAAICINNGLPGRIYTAHMLPDNPQGERFRHIDAADVQSLDFDFKSTITEIENEFSRLSSKSHAGKNRDRVLLVGVKTRDGGSSEDTMAELAELAKSAGLEIARSYIQSRLKPDPRFLIGKGKVFELILDSMQLGAEMIIFDCPLSPAQARSLSAMTDVEVLDRNQLILAIFGQRAKSKAGQLQVELASLHYELPRLHKRAEGLSRITGGIGALGPGETKLEIHRRLVRSRISHLERQIDHLGKQRNLRSKRRRNSKAPVVSLVGYTNSGKSTLLNRMTASSVLAKDQLFATLDPISRRISFGMGKEFVISDTVGFIRDLPRDLMESFRATLEELYEADLLLHLVDISNPSYEAQIESVERILEQLKLNHIPQMLVYNKCDRLWKNDIRIVEEDLPESQMISATSGKNVDKLLRAVKQRILGDP